MTDHEKSPREDREMPPRLAIGRVVGPHGIRGEFRMYILTHFPERIAQLTGVYIGDDGVFRRVRRSRLQGNLAILQVEGIEDRDAAEALRDQSVRIDVEHAAPLEEGEYYHFQIIGLRAVDEAGTELGTVAEIIETGSNDVYVIRNEDGKELLVPALVDVVPEIDPDNGTIVVRPPAYYGDDPAS